MMYVCTITCSVSYNKSSCWKSSGITLVMKKNCTNIHCHLYQSLLWKSTLKQVLAKAVLKLISHFTITAYIWVALCQHEITPQLVDILAPWGLMNRPRWLNTCSTSADVQGMYCRRHSQTNCLLSLFSAWVNIMKCNKACYNYCYQPLTNP